MGPNQRRIAVVTAVHPNHGQHIEDTWASLLDQVMPQGWEWVWVIHQDGPGDTIASTIPVDDPRIRFTQGRHSGVAAARNLALANALDCTLCRVVDADDQLTLGALFRDIMTIQSHSSVRWTTSRVLDLLPDGSTASFPDDPPGGIITSGTVYSYWANNDFRAQVHPTTLCAQTSLLVELGGWTGIPASEDTGLLLALDAVSDGFFTEQHGVLYRKWNGQMTAQPDHINPQERSARMKLIGARARMLRSPVSQLSA